jgi:hypothetical protein
MISENDLFNWIKKNFIKDLKPSEKPTSRYDCFSEQYNLDIELKCRRTHYPDLIIEKKKYDALMHRSKEFGTIPVYINSTPEGVWAFYVNDIKIDWQNKLLPKQTDFSDNTFIEKRIGYLTIDKGIELTSKVKW